MKKRYIAILCAVLFAATFRNSAQAAMISYNLESFAGDPMEMTLTINDTSLEGFLRFDLAIADPNTTGNIGDLRGFFFNIDPFAHTLVSTDFFGTNLTQVLISDDSLKKAGPGNTVEPAGLFDVGIEFGTPGIGTDDIQSTSFYMDTKGGAITLNSLISETDDLGFFFAARFTSVGPVESDRDGSSKISLLGAGTPVPVPSTIILLGTGMMGIVGLIRRRKGMTA